MSDHPTPERILQTRPRLLGLEDAAQRRRDGLFTELAKAPADLETLRGRLGLHPRSARDFLDALVALGLLERDDGDRTPTRPRPTSSSTEHKPSYVGGMLEMANAPPLPLLGPPDRGAAHRPAAERGEDRRAAALRGALRRPGAAARVPRGDDRASAAARTARSPRKFPWSDYKTFVDVGTAQGDLAVQVALANPHLRGIGFDLPEVGPIFEEYVAAQRPGRAVSSSRPATSSRTPLPKADVVADGPHPARLGPAEKKMLIAQGLRRAARRAARSSSTRRSSTTTARRTPSAC